MKISMDAFRQPQALIFDLDGTLTESKSSMETEVGDRLGELLERIPVGIMSGGSYFQFQKQVLPFLPREARLERLTLFPTSAARCYEFKDSEWQLVYSYDFSQEEKKEIMIALQKGILETKIINNETPKFGERIEDRETQISFSALGQEAPIELKRLWDPTKEKRVPLQKILIKALPKYSIRINASNTIDITREGITKAHGVRRFSNMLGLPIKEMLYVGDALFEGGNDAIVKETGILTYSVTSPAETLEFIMKFLDKSSG